MFGQKNLATPAGKKPVPIYLSTDALAELLMSWQ